VVDKVDVALDFVGRDYTARSVPLVTPGGIVVRVPSEVDEEAQKQGEALGVRVTKPEQEFDHIRHGVPALSRVHVAVSA